MKQVLSILRSQSPLLVQVGYGWARRRILANEIWDNSAFKIHSHLLRETQWWTTEQLQELQLHRLRSLIHHAYENVPYYRSILENSGVHPRDVSTLEDLQRLPLLTRDDVRRNINNMVAQNVDPADLISVTTGGSTGKPVALYVDPATSDPLDSAFTIRQWEWAGYQPGDRIATLRGNLINPIQKRRNGKRDWWEYDTSSNELVLSTFEMSEDNLPAYVKTILRFSPKYIRAYPSSLEVLCRFLLRSRMGPLRVRAVLLESETVYPWQRRLFESALGCEVFAGYGMTERAADAVECERHTGYHVSMEYGILELVDERGQPLTEPGAMGRVVGTGFDTYCMPFIRYVTDDLATMASSRCSCQRGLILIQQFEGRIREFIVSKHGKLVSLSALNLHTHVNAKIREFQFLQKREGELIVKVSRAPQFTETEIRSELLEELHKRLYEDEFKIAVQFVETVTRTTRGKVSLLEQRLPFDFESNVNLITGNAAH